MNKKRILEILKEVWRGMMFGIKLSLVIVIMTTGFVVSRIDKNVTHQNTLVDTLAYRIKYSEAINKEIIKGILESEIELTKNVVGVLKNQTELTKGLTSLLDYVNMIADKTTQNAKEIRTPNLIKLIKANVIIINTETTFTGSGTIIKYEGKLYVLSVAHLNGTSEMCLDGEKNYRTLKTIKMDKKKDLALFELPRNVENVDYIEISKAYPKVGDKIWIVSNPFGLKDTITSGILAKHTGEKWYVTAPIYFGSSGGAVVNQMGELIGVAHALQISLRAPLAIGVIIDLETILDFLEEE